MLSEPTLSLSSDVPRHLTPDDILEMYQVHAAFLRQLLLRFGVREADVDDLLQDVFVVALRRQSDFEGRSTVRTWLCGIALRLATAHVRRRRVRELFRGSTRLAAPSAEDVTANPERALEQSRARDEVLRTLDRLSPKKRAVLVLYEIEQLSGDEIAEIVGCPVKTVWTRLFHARRDFTTALRRQGLLDPGEGP
jgi:RNA polymerase sigma-70 factor (ECF subfamily)